MDAILAEMDSLIAELREVAEDYRRIAAETQEELELMDESRPR